MIKIYTLAIIINEYSRHGDTTQRFEAKTAIGLKEYNKTIDCLFNDAIFSSYYLEYQMSSFLMKEENKEMLLLFTDKKITDRVEIEQFLMNLDRKKIIEILGKNYSINKLIKDKFLEEVTDMELKVTERKVDSVTF